MSHRDFQTTVLLRSAESGGHVALVAKYVRADKQDGSLLPENTGAAAIWNWRP